MRPHAHSLGQCSTSTDAHRNLSSCVPLSAQGTRGGRASRSHSPSALLGALRSFLLVDVPRAQRCPAPAQQAARRSLHAPGSRATTGAGRHSVAAHCAGLLGRAACSAGCFIKVFYRGAFSAGRFIKVLSRGAFSQGALSGCFIRVFYLKVLSRGAFSGCFFSQGVLFIKHLHQGAL